MMPNALSSSQVQTGMILGEGRFGTIREITISDEHNHIIPLFRPPSVMTVMEDETGHEIGSGDYISGARTAAIKKNWHNYKVTTYVAKCLRESLQGEERISALVDLETEAKILASIAHPNIVNLWGTLGDPGNPDFMIVLDRLYMILPDKLALWKTARRQVFPLCLLRLTKYATEQTSTYLIIERLLLAYNIANVMQYLHENNIIYRDLKPQNVGFDIQGDLRIFDFGLARKLQQVDLSAASHDYRCTGLAGSRRWMAPEVYLCKPYGFSADVYSFGLLFWNIFSLKTPYGRISVDQHYKNVIKNNQRPPNLKILPVSLGGLMSHCWDSKRPSFKAICSLIKCELLKLQHETHS